MRTIGPGLTVLLLAAILLIAPPVLHSIFDGTRTASAHDVEDIDRAIDARVQSAIAHGEQSGLTLVYTGGGDGQQAPQLDITHQLPSGVTIYGGYAAVADAATDPTWTEAAVTRTTSTTPVLDLDAPSSGFYRPGIAIPAGFEPAVICGPPVGDAGSVITRGDLYVGCSTQAQTGLESAAPGMVEDGTITISGTTHTVWTTREALTGSGGSARYAVELRPT